MAETLIMEEIKRLTAAYIQHNHHAFFVSEHLKYWDVFDIDNNAQTPQQVLNYLHEKHGHTPYENLLRHEVLVMNRTPWLLWLIQAFVIFVTFPLSIPMLMFWSWFKRGTVNFFKTDGAIYLEKVLSLCNQAGVDLPQLSSNNSLPKQTVSTASNPVLNQGANMQASTHPAALLPSAVPPIQQPNPMQALVAAAPAISPRPESVQPDIQPPSYPDFNDSVMGMGNMACAFTQTLRDNPTIFLEAELSRTRGEPVILDSFPLEAIAPHRYRLRFSYASLWTGPWQELAAHSTELTIFSQFTWVRHLSTTAKIPMNVSPRTDLLGKTYARCLSLYRSDCSALITKGIQNYARGPMANKYFKEALSAAKNNEECVNALEALINWQDYLIKRFKEVEPAYRTKEGPVVPYYINAMQSLKDDLAGYLDLLPENYPVLSVTARAIQACLEQTWGHLACHRLQLAADVYFNLEIDKLISTPFVQRALPHLVAMHKQLHVVFLLNNTHPSWPADVAHLHLDKFMLKARDLGPMLTSVHSILQNYNAPEISDFIQSTLRPFERMIQHIEQLFAQTPRENIHRNGIEEFIDDHRWKLEGRTKSYRMSSRGQPLAYKQHPEMLAISKRILLQLESRNLTGPSCRN